jgi:pyrroline-5-carboxylate reductase
MRAKEALPLKLLLVGCGHIGSALLSGWLKQRGRYKINVVTPHQTSLGIFLNDPDVTWFQTPEAIQEYPDFIIFAIKPQVLQDVLPAYKRFFEKNSFFISVAAGKTLEFYYPYLGQAINLVRAMPNTPATIGKGITLLLKNEAVSLQQKAVVEELFKALGECWWMDTEDQFDCAAALTACGPAYVFNFVESLASAAEELGFPRSLANRWAQTLVIGSSTFLEQSKESPETLRIKVTSPGGMTEAGLKILNHKTSGLQPLLKETIKAAYQRAIDMRDVKK